MPYTVCLGFDENTQKALEGLWSRLSDLGISDFVHIEKSVPHMTMAHYDNLDLEQVVPRLRTFAGRMACLNVKLRHVGLIAVEKGVVYISPVVTHSLLEIHAMYHEMMADLARPSRSYDEVDNWDPHVTIALGMGDDDAHRVLGIAAKIWQPVKGQIDHLLLIEFKPHGPSHIVQSFPLM